MINFITDASALILKPKQTLLDWLESEAIKNKIPSETFEVLNTRELSAFRMNGTVITIPFVTTNLFEESNKFIEANPDKILSIELSRWGLDMSALPSKKPLDLLKEWFDITFHARIFYITE